MTLKSFILVHNVNNDNKTIIVIATSRESNEGGRQKYQRVCKGSSRRRERGKTDYIKESLGLISSKNGPLTYFKERPNGPIVSKESTRKSLLSTRKKSCDQRFKILINTGNHFTTTPI